VRRIAENSAPSLARYAREGTYEFRADHDLRPCLGALWSKTTKCRGTLRAVVGGAFDGELLEPTPHGIGVETQDTGRALRPLDHPTSSPEDVQDVVTLHIFQGEARTVGGRRDGLAEDVRADLQRRRGREDDGALEEVLQLADVAGPGLGGQPLHRRWADHVDA
jgi:hypothetical protein